MVVGLSLYALYYDLSNTTKMVYTLVMYTIQGALLVGGTFYSVMVRHKRPLFSIGLKSDRAVTSLGYGAVMAPPLFAVAFGISWVLQELLKPIIKPTSSISSYSTGALVLFTVMAVVLAPICEEIFFRGYLYPVLRNRFDAQPAMLINAALFAVVHRNLVSFLPIALVGYALCYITEKTENIAGPILCHAAYNALVLATLRFVFK